MSGKSCNFASKMLQTSNTYWFGVASTAYLVSCWIFAAVRWWHTCREPKERHDYIWPERKMQVVIYLMGTVLLPYVLNPESESAWTLWKSYFPGTYYFYGCAMFFCFFGTIKRWQRWKSAIRTTAVITAVTMMPLVADAWTGGRVLTADFARLWQLVVAAVGVMMMVYCALAMRQTLRWIQEIRDDNYSNPDDFPMDFARRVWLLPVAMTLLVWPPFIFDSPVVMAVMNVLLAVFNIVMLIFVLPVWRRASMVPDSAESTESSEDSECSEYSECSENSEHSEISSLARERERKIMEEIECYVKDEHAYLDEHLKLEQVVDHCSYSRTYVSKVFQDHYQGFSTYVNRLRFEHYDRYMQRHPNATKDTAAQESGFTSYNAYYKAKERIEGKE